MKTQVRSNYFAAVTADLNYRSVIEVGDMLELVVTDTQGNIVSEKFNFTVNAANLANAVLSVKLTDIGTTEAESLVAELSESL